MAYIDESDNIKGVQLSEQGSDPATPSAGFQKLYAKSGGVFIEDSTGTVHPVATGSTAAPIGAKYITQVPDGTLTNEQALSSLATGVVKNTTTTGVLSIATPGTDYSTPTGTENLQNKTITLSSLIASALSVIIGGFKAIFTHSNTADRTYSLPDATTTLVGTDTTQTLTNKSISGSQIDSGTVAATRLGVMTGDSGSGGAKGAVPAPGAGDTAAAKFLKADGSWAVPAGSGGGSGGHIIQDNSSDMTARSHLNFIGATVTDNAGDDSTDITITGGGSGSGIQDIEVTKTAFQQRVILHNETLGSAGTFDVSSIDQTYDYLELRMRLRANTGSTNIAVYFNNDTTDANYTRVRLIATDSATIRDGDQQPIVSVIPGSGSASGSFATFVVVIPSYATAGLRRIATSDSGFNESSTSEQAEREVATWNSTSAINRISVGILGGGSLATGSQLQIIGIKAMDVVTDVVGSSPPAAGIKARYTTATAQALTNSAFTVIDYTTKTFDTDNAVTTGSGWKFTAPRNGYYRVSASLLVGTGTNGLEFYIRKNGTVYAQLARGGIVWGSYTQLLGMSLVSLNKGDYIDLAVYNSTGGSVSLYTDAGLNHIDIESTDGSGNQNTVVAVPGNKTRYTTHVSQSFSYTVEGVIDFETKDFDTDNAVTTGSGWKFTAPRNGYYRINVNILMNSSSGNFGLNLYKNGAMEAALSYGATPFGSNSNCQGVTTVYLSAGDYISVKMYNGVGIGSTVSTFYGGDSDLYNYIDITSIDAASLAPAPGVKARYTRSTAQALTNGITTVVNFTTAAHDTDSAVTTGSGWKFTAPRDGYYRVSSNVMVDTTNTTMRLDLLKNGSTYCYLCRTGSNGGDGYINLAGSTTIYLLKNDYIQVGVSNASGVSVNTHTDDYYVYIDIESIDGGNNLLVTDGTLSVSGVNQIIVAPGSFIDNGDGSVTLDMSPKRVSVWADELLAYNSSNTPLSMTLALGDDRFLGGVSGYQSTPNNGDYFTFSAMLAAGSYTLTTVGNTDTNRGKVDYYVDGILIASGQDWYAASTLNVPQSFTFSLATSGFHVFKVVVNGHNGSSSNYYWVISKVAIVPSAD